MMERAYSWQLVIEVLILLICHARPDTYAQAQPTSRAAWRQRLAEHLPVFAGRCRSNGTARPSARARAAALAPEPSPGVRTS